MHFRAASPKIPQNLSTSESSLTAPRADEAACLSLAALARDAPAGAAFGAAAFPAASVVESSPEADRDSAPDRVPARQPPAAADRRCRRRRYFRPLWADRSDQEAPPAAVAEASLLEPFLAEGRAQVDSEWHLRWRFLLQGPRG